MYVDETGDLGTTGKAEESQYFGIGSATFSGPHAEALWAGKDLRFAFESRGLSLPHGFHAKNDSARTRHDVYATIGRIAPRFDFTMLDKRKAFPRVLERGEVYLYKLAWYLHFKEIIYRVSSAGDRVFVAAGTLGTASRRMQASAALREVCTQVSVRRVVHLATWDAKTSFGIQVADYGLWAVQRSYERGDVSWYDKYIAASTVTCFRPWN